MPQIRPYLTYLDAHAVAPEAPHGAMHERELAEQTATLAYRVMGNSMSYVFPDPDFAPSIDIASGNVGTWLSFVTGDSSAYTRPSYQLPWRLTENYASVLGIAEIVAPPMGVDVQTRLLSDDLVDVVAQATGTGVGLQVKMDQAHQMDEWLRINAAGNGKYMHLVTGQMLLTPTLPANRRVAIYPQIKVGDKSDSVFDGGGTTRIYLKSLMLYDIPANTVGF